VRKSPNGREIKAKNKNRLTEAGKEGRVRIVASMGFWQADPGEWVSRLNGSCDLASEV